MSTAITTRAHQTAKQRVQGKRQLKLIKLQKKALNENQLNFMFYFLSFYPKVSSKSFTNQPKPRTTFYHFRPKKPRPRQHENTNVDLGGQVSKKHEVLKASNTKEPSVQSESIC